MTTLLIAIYLRLSSFGERIAKVEEKVRLLFGLCVRTHSGAAGAEGCQ